jgi:hypothetical protein
LALVARIGGVDGKGAAEHAAATVEREIQGNHRSSAHVKRNQQARYRALLS